MIENKPNMVRSLTCKRDLDMAIVCYNSFLRHNRQASSLVVHTDGSLSNADIDKLYSSVNNIQVIDRKDNEEYVQEVLAKYPNCLKYRSIEPMGNKLLDIPIIENNCLRFIDCDILFLKAFDKLFSEDCSSRFCLEDDDCAYSGRLADIMKASKNTIPRGCNTGIFQMEKSKFDLDYIEWFLGQQHLCMFLPVVEQTLFGEFMGSSNSFTYKSDRISTSRYNINLTKHTLAIHFMNGLKERFWQYAKDYENPANDEVSFFELNKSERLGYPYIIKRSLNRRLKSSFGWNFQS